MLKSNAILLLSLLFLASATLPLPENCGQAGLLIACFILLTLLYGILQRRQTASYWVARLLALAANFTVFAGGLLAVLAAGISTTAAAVVGAFQVLALAATLATLSAHLDLPSLGYRNAASRGGWGRRRIALITILLLGSWSWGSALRMALQVGAVQAGAEYSQTQSCILIAKNSSEYQEVDNIWDMRLPRFYADWTGPTGTTLLAYHAILVRPEDPVSLYTWSKTRMRFEPRDRTRNPYLPRQCR